MTEENNNEGVTGVDMSGHDKSSPDMSRHDQSRLDMTSHDQTSPDMSDYTMTIDEAYARFSEAGIKRNRRSIVRYCEFNQLDSVKLMSAFGPRWLLNPDSVEGKIKKIKHYQETGVMGVTGVDTPPGQGVTSPVMSPMTGVDMTSHDQTSPAMSTPVTPPVAPPSEEITQLKKENEALKDKNLNLTIDNRAKEQVISILNRERGNYVEQLKDQAMVIGGLKQEVLQLEAPPGAPREYVEIVSEPENVKPNYPHENVAGESIL